MFDGLGEFPAVLGAGDSCLELVFVSQPVVPFSPCFQREIRVIVLRNPSSRGDGLSRGRVRDMSKLLFPTLCAGGDKYN